MSGRLGTNKDLEALARKARKHGWKVEVTRGNHIRWLGPAGELLITSLSGSVTSVRKARASLAKAGVR